MKTFKKILIILSLSFFLTSVLTPKHEKEAHAFVLTGSMALGALAIAGAGGLISYANRDLITSFGNTMADKLAGTDINLTDMFATNEYGLNKTVTDKLAETVAEKQAIFNANGYTSNAHNVTHVMQFMTIPDDLISKVDDVNQTIRITINHLGDEIAIGAFMTVLDGWRPLSSLAGDATYISHDLDQTVIEIEAYDNYTTRNNIVKNKGLVFEAPKGAVEVSFHMQAYSGNIAKREMESMSQLTNYDDITSIQNQFQTVYGENTVSFDYDALTQVLTDAQAPPVSLTNIESIVSGLNSSIVDAGADTVGVLTTIWNGIKNIPQLIQSSSTAVLGGISSLSDDLLIGLGTFTGNMIKANEDLWADAGVVWSGMTSAIENMGTNVADSVTNAVTGALTGIDTLVGDLGTVIGTLPDTISSSITGALTGLGDVVSDLSSTVRTIPGTISTSITDAFTSAFSIPDNYFTTRITAIQQILVPKLPKFPSKEAIFPSDFEEQGDWAGISVDFEHYGIGEQMVIDNQAPNFYRRQIKLWISAILYFFTALFVIKKVAGVINK